MEVTVRSRRSHEYREAVLPGPGPDSGYRRILFVGATGSGKTTLIRQLLGTEGEGFPAVSVAKTTVAETEVLLAPGDFYAVATFMSADETRLLVEECAASALGSLRDGRNDAAVQRVLLSHSDQRFHLRHLLGPVESKGGADLDQARWLVKALAGLREVAGRVDTGRAIDWVAQVETLREEPAFNRAIDAIMSEIRDRFDLVETGELKTDADGWPHAWHLVSPERASLLHGLAPLVGNEGVAFGRLLTPLVNGLRVRGPFHPDWAPEVPYLMLTDTEGMGHTPDTAAALSSRLLDAADRADRIVIVDNALVPGQAATAAAIRQLAEAGHTAKLSVCFTHLDLVKGPNMASEQSRRDFLRVCLDQVIDAAGQHLGPSLRFTLQRRLDEHVFFVGRPQVAGHPDETDPWVGQLRRLLRSLRKGAAPLDAGGPRLTYRREDMLRAVEAGVVEFRERALQRAGQASDDPRERRWWKSFSRRLNAQIGEEMEGFRPAPELARAIGNAVRAVAETPVEVSGAPLSDVTTPELIDLFIRRVHTRVRGLGHRWLIEDALLDWDRLANGLGFEDGEVERLRRLLDRQLGLDQRGSGLLADARELVEAAAGEVGMLFTHRPPAVATAGTSSGRSAASPAPGAGQGDAAAELATA
jgi:hypothetical protein